MTAAFRILKWAVTAVLMVWASLGLVVQTLIIFIGIDIASGLLSAYIRKEISSSKSFKGIARKVLILVMVGVSHLAGQAMQLKFDLGTGVAAAYLFNEVISIMENCAKAGLFIPSILVQALIKVKQTARAATPAEIAELEDNGQGAAGSRPPGKEV